MRIMLSANSPSSVEYSKLLGEQMTPVRTSHSSLAGFRQWNFSESLKKTMVRPQPMDLGCLSRTESDSTKESWPGACGGVSFSDAERRAVSTAPADERIFLAA